MHIAKRTSVKGANPLCDRTTRLYPLLLCKRPLVGAMAPQCSGCHQDGQDPPCVPRLGSAATSWPCRWVGYQDTLCTKTAQGGALCIPSPWMTNQPGESTLDTQYNPYSGHPTHLHSEHTTHNTLSIMELRSLRAFSFQLESSRSDFSHNVVGLRGSSQAFRRLHHIRSASAPRPPQGQYAHGHICKRESPTPHVTWQQSLSCMTKSFPHCYAVLQHVRAPKKMSVPQ